MDDVIYEEFKGTGNSELVLSRNLAERRVFPALDIRQSGTRKEELMISRDVLEQLWNIRRSMRGDALEYTEQILQLMKNTKNNDEFIANLKNLNFGKKS